MRLQLGITSGGEQYLFGHVTLIVVFVGHVTSILGFDWSEADWFNHCHVLESYSVYISVYGGLHE